MKCCCFLLVVVRWTSNAEKCALLHLCILHSVLSRSHSSSLPSVPLSTLKIDKNSVWHWLQYDNPFAMMQKKKKKKRTRVLAEIKEQRSKQRICYSVGVFQDRLICIMVFDLLAWYVWHEANDEADLVNKLINDYMRIKLEQFALGLPSHSCKCNVSYGRARENALRTYIFLILHWAVKHEFRICQVQRDVVCSGLMRQRCVCVCAMCTGDAD